MSWLGSAFENRFQKKLDLADTLAKKAAEVVINS